MVYNLGWIYGNFPNYLWTLKDFIITKGCIKSIAKKNKNLEGIFMGHDCYSFIHSIEVSKFYSHIKSDDKNTVYPCI